jgi:hypothetical protein
METKTDVLFVVVSLASTVTVLVFLEFFSVVMPVIVSLGLSMITSSVVMSPVIVFLGLSVIVLVFVVIGFSMIVATSVAMFVLVFIVSTISGVGLE